MRFRFAVRWLDGDDAIGVSEWHWTDEHVIDHREHGRGRGDTERESSDDGDREARRATNLAYRVSHILHGAFQPEPAPGSAGYVFDERQVAEFALHRGTRFFG